MRRALFIAPFDELANPRSTVELGVLAERVGWDGFFLWDHVQYPVPVDEISDPWAILAALAVRTEEIRIGALVTPLARRRPWVLARQALTIDHLSGGRIVLGLGVGGDGNGEMEPFGEEGGMRARAEMLDEGLELLDELFSGKPVEHRGTHYSVVSKPFLPRPIQRPRIPIWIGARWPARRPVLRAARWDGVFPIDIGVGELGELRALIAEGRPEGTGPIELVARIDPGEDPEPWEAAGVDWLLTELGPRWSDDDGLVPPPSLEEVHAVVAVGPGRAAG